MKQIHRLNSKKQEKIKSEKYRTEDLFERNKLQQEETREEKQVQEQALTKNEESFFRKILNKIKSLLKK